MIDGKIILQIAKKTFVSNCKNYWVFLVTLLLSVINYAVIHFNTTFNGFENQANTSAMLMSLSHLQMYLVSLFALMISYDGMLKEQELGTLSLLLTYPLQSRDIVLGKWLGYSLILSVAIIISFIMPTYTLLNVGVSVATIVLMIFFSLWLGIIFVSLGLFVSTLSHDRAFVIAMSIIIWLFFVFLFDLIFVLLVVYTNGIIAPQGLNILLLFNPVDMFRISGLLLNLTKNTQQFYGIGQGVLQLGYCIIALISWVLIPLLFTLRKNFVSHRN